MTTRRTFGVPQHVVARPVADETIVLDLAGGSYFGLDPVGSRIWAELAAGKPVSEICEAMLSEYDVERETLEQDVSSLVEDLCRRELLRPVGRDDE